MICGRAFHLRRSHTAHTPKTEVIEQSQSHAEYRENYVNAQKRLTTLAVFHPLASQANKLRSGKERTTVWRTLDE